MGNVARLDTVGNRGGSPPLPAAIAAYLATVESPGTQRAYRSTLRALREEFSPPGGPPIAIADFDTDEAADQVTVWFTGRWGQRAPATFNRNLDAVRSAVRYWQDQHWLSADPTRRLRRRSRTPDRTRALAHAEIDALFDEDLALRERTLYTLLYESAARASEVLALGVQDLDLKNRRAKVRRKGGAIDTIVWQTRTARLLPRLINGRKKGPLFLTDRKARVELPAGDLCPYTGRARLSYRRAEEIFEQTTRAPANPGVTDPGDLHQAQGWTLHQLRHSALTHAAEDGANTSTLLAFSGHTSVVSLARYTRVSAEALGRWQAGRDPRRRR